MRKEMTPAIMSMAIDHKNRILVSILSCTNIHQLNACRNLIENFKRVWKSYLYKLELSIFEMEDCLNMRFNLSYEHVTSNSN